MIEVGSSHVLARDIIRPYLGSKRSREQLARNLGTGPSSALSADRLQFHGDTNLMRALQHAYEIHINQKNHRIVRDLYATLQ